MKSPASQPVRPSFFKTSTAEMLNVGLTGNIAAGKSTVLALFAKWGATVIDADALVHEVQAPGSPVLAEIAARFGQGMIQGDGSLDRASLRRAVAGNKEALDTLNAIVHPSIQRRREELEAEARHRGDCIVVNDIPLLFEVLDPETFDSVILVDAPEAVRRERLMRERGLSGDDADQLISSQMSSADKRGPSRFVIDNVGSEEALEAAALKVWQIVRTEAAAKKWGGSGPLLAMFAHPDDETFAIGGTLARYADAGAEVHVWCATRGEAGRLNGERASPEETRAVRTEELGRAIDALGVHAVHALEFPDGSLRPDDRAGRQAAAEALRRVQPEVVITFGADGVTGHADHLAVHRWVDDALRDLASTARVFYVTYPGPISDATGGRIAARPDDQIVATLDIRPWRNAKIAAIDAHASQRFPFALDTPPGSLLMAQEWFAGTGRTKGPIHDLYETPRRA